MKKGREAVIFSNSSSPFSYLCIGIEASLSGAGRGEPVMAWSPPHGNSTASSCKPSNGEAKLPETGEEREREREKQEVD